MSVRGHCPRCGVPIEFEAEHAGAGVACPSCAAEIVLQPDPAGELTAAAAAGLPAGSRTPDPAKPKPSPPEWELRDRAPEPRLSAGDQIPELARKQAEEAALEGARIVAMEERAASEVRAKRLGITLETARRESAYGALRGLIGMMAVAGYVFAGLIAVAGLLAMPKPDAGTIFGIPAALAMFGIAAAMAFLVRASHQALLLLVDIADCNVRILTRLNELAARSPARPEAPKRPFQSTQPPAQPPGPGAG